MEALLSIDVSSFNSSAFLGLLYDSVKHEVEGRGAIRLSYEAASTRVQATVTAFSADAATALTALLVDFCAQTLQQDVEWSQWYVGCTPPTVEATVVDAPSLPPTAPPSPSAPRAPPNATTDGSIGGNQQTFFLGGDGMRMRTPHTHSTRMCTPRVCTQHVYATRTCAHGIMGICLLMP